MLQLQQFHASGSNNTTTNSHGGRSHDNDDDDENNVDDDDDDDDTQRFAALRSATVGSGTDGGPARPAAAQAHQHRPDLFQASLAKNVLEFRRLSIAVRELPGMHLFLIRQLVARQKAVRSVSS